MTELLVRIFVKEYRQTENPQVRTRYGILASIVGICCNVALFLAKLTVGLLVNSIAIMADAFNNLSDAAASIISFIGVKMAGKPADKEHPFGHGRIEYIAAFIVAFLVIQVAFSLMKGSVQKIFSSESMAFRPAALCVLVVSAAGKLWLSVFNRKLGKRIQSKVMLATAADALGDVCATGATIASFIIFGIWHINIDGIIGLIVSILVLVAGVNITKDTLAPLIGEPIDPETYRRIIRFVEGYDGIVGSHDLIVHNYGPGHSMATIHAEVPKDMEIEEAHQIVDQIEKDILKQMGIFTVIHMDPVDMKDSYVDALKFMVQEVVKGLDSRLSIHDFQVHRQEKRTDVSFDVEVPRDYTQQMQEALKLEVSRRIRERDSQCYCVITTEYTFC